MQPSHKVHACYPSIWYAHAARGAFDLEHGALDVDGVQVFHLDFGNLAHLLASELADLVPIRLGRPFFDASRAADQEGGWGAFQDEA